MINWLLRSYTEEEFISAWNVSASYRGVANILNKTTSGGSIRILRETAEYLNLSTEHFHRKQQVVEYLFGEILIQNSPYTGTHNLKQKLVKAGLLELKCSADYCPFEHIEILNPFTGEKTELIFALDHINGINNDNRIENLRILCTHCHSLTPTWCKRNKKIVQV